VGMPAKPVRGRTLITECSQATAVANDPVDENLCWGCRQRTCVIRRKRSQNPRYIPTYTNSLWNALLRHDLRLQRRCLRRTVFWGITPSATLKVNRHLGGRMPSSGMLCCVALVSNVWEERSASIIRWTRIGEPATTLAVTIKSAVFSDIKTLFVPHRRHITSPLQSPAS
jgi:hypothetical protein